jgi:hypothetical protein
VNSLKLKKSPVAIGFVVGIVLGASSPAFPAPVPSSIAAVKAAVTRRCGNGALPGQRHRANAFLLRQPS